MDKGSEVVDQRGGTRTQTSDDNFVPVVQKLASDTIAKVNRLSTFPAKLQQTSI